MTKRVPLDANQFNVRMPKPKHDPLDAIIPTQSPVVKNKFVTEIKPKKNRKVKSVRTDVDTYIHTEVRTHVRSTIQRAYNIFQDQVIALSEVQLAHQKRDGKQPELSELVRNALDAYLKREKRKLEIK